MWKSLFSRKYFLASFLTGFVSALILFVGCSLHSKPSTARTSPSTGTSSGSPSAGANNSLLRESSVSFRTVAKTVGPAVVVIQSTLQPKWPRAHGSGGGPGLNPNDPFYEFFRQFMQPFGNPPEEQGPQTALGSGFIIDRSGYIVTNNHVVKGASKVMVNLPDEDNKDITAKVMGTDAKSDLAVIKIDVGRSLPVAQWADSDQVEVGDWALAIGSPFMLTHSVTLGIISAKGRSSANILGSGYGADLLQTDAAINPGNSGGPLCTIDSKVMGVNTAIYTESGGYMGIGFAIPSNLARSISEILMHGGKVVRGWLGVAIQPVDPELAKELGIANGVMVHSVERGSPADKAGFRPGDVIFELEGKQVTEPGQVQHLVSGVKPGTKITVKVVSYHDKKKRTVEVKIGQLPGGKEARKVQSESEEGESAPDRLGLSVSPAENGNGVRVDAVAEGSLGRMAGIEEGDVILSVNRRPIHSVSDYESQLKGSGNLNLLVNRNGEELFFQLTPP